MSSAGAFDWPSFYALFWNDKGLKCKVNIPDTVLFRYGQLSAWWATNKEGYIQRHTSQSTTLEAIRRRFLMVASEDEANYSKFVAISRIGDGRPQLLRVQAFNQLCEILSDRLESGHPDVSPEVETPTVLQAFIQPYQDVRYVTTYINNGANNGVTCHSFMRKFSRRYQPMSAVSAAAYDNTEADIILSGDDADARRAEIDQQQGAVDPVLKMQLRKLTSHIVKYIERAHSLTLGGMVCEYIRDAAGKVYLLSVLRTEWASNAAGNGSGSLAAANLTIEADDPWEQPDQEPMQQQGPGEMDAEPSSMQIYEDLDPSRQPSMAGGYSPAASPKGPGPAQGSLVQSPLPTSPRGVSSRPMSARPGPGSPRRSPSPTRGEGAGTTRSGLIQYPGGQRQGGIGVQLANTWPSKEHDAALAPSIPQRTISPTSHPTMSPIPETSTLGAASPSAAPGTTSSAPRAQSARVQNATTTPMAERRMPPRPGSSPSRISRGVPMGMGAGGPSPSRPGFNSTVERVFPLRDLAGFTGGGMTSPKHNRPVTARETGHVNNGVRGAPLLVQNLQKEVEQLRDQLMYQHDLAEASAAKVRQLEHEKGITTMQFDRRVNELEHLLANTQDELETMRRERNELRERCERAEKRNAQLEAEHGGLTSTLHAERGTTMNALREYQERDKDAMERIQQLESEVIRLNENLKQETTANNALKRQLLEFSDIAERYKNQLRDSEMEAGMQEVLDRTHNLFAEQNNPTGEQYSVQKVMMHYHADLRAVFLFYAQLDRDFTAHWPPSMSFTQWMLFCKDSETSDIRAGARIRSSQHFMMLKTADCEAIFRAYGRPDPTATSDNTEPVFSYESFLCAILHTAFKIRRSEVSFLSEALREYVLRYLSRAHRVNPAGMSRGQIRHAVEGTKGGKKALAAVGPGSPVATAGGKRGSRPTTASGVSGNKPPRLPSAGKGNGPLSKGRLQEALGHNSAIAAEMALMGLTGPGITKAVVRTGGGFDLP